MVGFERGEYSVDGLIRKFGGKHTARLSCIVGISECESDFSWKPILFVAWFKKRRELSPERFTECFLKP